MSKTYSMQGPDGKTYSIQGPDNADPQEVKKRIITNYKTATPAKPSIGQRMKTAAGRVATKVGQKVGQAVPPFMKQPMTWPEIGGQVAGEVAGGPLDVISRSMLPSTVLGGAGGVLGRTLGHAPQALGEMMAKRSIHTPMTHQIKEDIGPAFERGATFAGLGKTVPLAWRGLKGLGREIESGVGSLAGVGERVQQLKKLPFLKQLEVLKPGKTSIPTPDIAGFQQGALEKRLGIPTMQEAVEEQIYQEPGKKATSIRELKIPIKPSGATEADAAGLREALKKAIGETGKTSSPMTGRSTPAMRNVRLILKTGGEPETNEAIQALRDTGERMGKADKTSVLRSVYSKEFGAINNWLEKKIPKLAQARQLTHLSHIRDELLHILPMAPSGDPYRFGVMRLLWMLRTSISVLSGGLMSPYMAGAGGVAGDVLTKMMNPVLEGRFTAPAVSGALAARQKLKQKTP